MKKIATSALAGIFLLVFFIAPLFVEVAPIVSAILLVGVCLPIALLLNKTADSHNQDNQA